jgi:DNA repair protein RecO (recombination protein O)
MLTKDTAVCIRAVDYSETSQVVTFFTRSAGKITAIAKGSKRPRSAFGGPLEMFSHGRVVLSLPAKQKLATLTEFEPQPGLSHLAGEQFSLNCCFFAAELLSCLTDEYDPHPALFDAFLQFLINIDATDDAQQQIRNTTSLLILFQLTLLRDVGLMPVLNYCVNCKTRYEIQDTPQDALRRRYEFYFSSSANGLICRDCEAVFPDRIALSRSAAAVFSSLKLIAGTSQNVLGEIEKVLISHFTAILGRLPKMAKYILEKS